MPIDYLDLSESGYVWLLVSFGAFASKSGEAGNFSVFQGEIRCYFSAFKDSKLVLCNV